MENHPIPQDVTGFQFKLIGDMTIKQFAYLATGVVLGWAIFSLPVTSLIKIPFASFFILLGISFAFFSVGGRPMDVMIINFVKTLFRPTQFVYQAGGVNFTPPINFPKQTPAVQNPVITSQSPTPAEIKKLDEKEAGFFETLANMFHSQNFSNTPPNNQSINIKPRIVSADNMPEAPKKKSFVRAPDDGSDNQEEHEVMELNQKQAQLAQALEQAKIEEKKDEGSNLYEDAHKKVLEIENLLNDTVLQKQQLEAELINLKKQLEESRKQVFTPSVAMPEKKETQNVRVIPQNQSKSAGTPFTSEYPNIISGVVKDPRGNPLANILVEVKDKEGNPVRAFKTNPVGQFAASTPLTNGVYRVEFEDPEKKNKFEIIEFEAAGAIILPIEVTSVDMREELRKTLFS